MKLIDYGKYKKRKWTPRITIVLAVMEAVVTGMFLGVALISAVYSSDTWNWIWLLAMGIGFAVGTLEATLIALHNCSSSAEAGRIETSLHNAGV
jgi:hypothetical protein